MVMKEMDLLSPWLSVSSAGTLVEAPIYRPQPRARFPRTPATAVL
jgi:hypothetical protein